MPPDLDPHLAALLNDLQELLAALQRDKRRQFDRHVAIGDLLTDRSANATQYGFGEGTTCYDNVLILGDVKVGRDSWIGPNAVLDGQGGLTIGDHCNIGPGVQIYSHNGLKRITSMGMAEVSFAPTRIGNGVYIGPGSVVEMGVTIGDGAVIGAMSLVRHDVPAGGRAWGCPARLQTDIALDDLSGGVLPAPHALPPTSSMCASRSAGSS